MQSKDTSPRKLASARANGALSHGPVTPEGKQRSARNSLKHGLAAHSLILPGESEKTFNEVRDMYYKQFRPRTLYESNLVDNLIAAYWRQSRAMAMESVAYAVEIEEQRPSLDSKFEWLEPDARAVLALRGDLHGDGTIVTCTRYSLRFERQWNRTLDKLLALLRQPPIGPTLEELDAELASDLAPAPPESATENVKNEPNPISGQSPILRFRDVIGVHPRPSAANSTILAATQ